MKVVSDRKILEIGPGLIAISLAKSNPNAKITGVDLGLLKNLMTSIGLLQAHTQKKRSE